MITTKLVDSVDAVWTVVSKWDTVASAYATQIEGRPETKATSSTRVGAQAHHFELLQMKIGAYGMRSITTKIESRGRLITQYDDEAKGWGFSFYGGSQEFSQHAKEGWSANTAFIMHCA